VLSDLEKAIEASGVDRVYVVDNWKEALKVIEEVVNKKEVDLLLIDDVLARLIGKGKLSEIKYKSPLPAIIELETNRIKKPLSS
ncbi:MAG: V-type ATP synthase subunit F, partial [Infirmifilum sp.]